MNTMNKITHHLSDQLLIGYSAGSLPEAFNLVVANPLKIWPTRPWPRRWL